MNNCRAFDRVFLRHSLVQYVLCCITASGTYLPFNIPQCIHEACPIVCCSTKTPDSYHSQNVSSNLSTSSSVSSPASCTLFIYLRKINSYITNQ